MHILLLSAVEEETYFGETGCREGLTPPPPPCRKDWGGITGIFGLAGRGALEKPGGAPGVLSGVSDKGLV